MRIKHWGFRKMTEYTDTGLESLGSIPSHWEKCSIRAITRLRNERGRPELPLLSVYRDYGVILKSSRDDNRNPEGQDLSTYKVVHIGDLVLNKMKTWQGSLGVSEFKGIVSPAYIVCALREDMNPRFIHYLLRSDPYVYEYNRISYGVRVGQWDMRYDEFKRIPLYLPPTPEQEKIVAFLDARLNELFQLISRYRQLVGVAAKSLAEKEKSLLHVYRKSLITEAVTGKLDVRGVELSKLDEPKLMEDREIGEEAEVDEAGDTEEVADGEEQ